MGYGEFYKKRLKFAKNDTFLLRLYPKPYTLYPNIELIIVCYRKIGKWLVVTTTLQSRAGKDRYIP